MEAQDAQVESSGEMPPQSVAESGEAKEIELMGNEIRIQRVVEGEGGIAEVNVTVECNVKGYFFSLAEGRRLRETPFEDQQNQLFQIGEADGVPGLELGLRHSKVGDKLLIRVSSRFGFGEVGRNYDKNLEDCPALDSLPAGVVPPKMDLEFEVEVLSHTQDQQLNREMSARYEKLRADLEDEEQKDILLRRLLVLQGLNLRKDVGNRWFHCKDYGRAAKSYSRATKLADTYFNKEKNDKLSLAQTIEEKAQAMAEAENSSVHHDDLEVVAVYVTCLNNLAACKLAQGEYLAAKDLCVKVLEIEPKNNKALIRATKASLALDVFEEAEACLRVLQKREDLDESQQKEVSILSAKLRKARHDYKEKTKQMQQKIANSLFTGKEGKKSKKREGEASPAPETPTPAVPPAPAPAPAPVSQTGKEEPAAHKEEKSTRKEHAEQKTVAQKTALNPNMIFLLGTSIAVVIVSLLVATFYHR